MYTKEENRELYQLLKVGVEKGNKNAVLNGTRNMRVVDLKKFCEDNYVVTWGSQYRKREHYIDAIETNIVQDLILEIQSRKTKKSC